MDEALDVARHQAIRRIAPRHFKKYIFISHPLDNSGASFVLLDIITEFAAEFGGSRVHVAAPEILPQHRKRLQRIRVRCSRTERLGRWFVRLQLSIAPNDFVLLNTVVVLDGYRDYILHLLENGRIKHAFWFTHESAVIATSFLAPDDLNRVSRLANEGKLTILTPSARISQEYNALLKTDKVKTVALRVDVEKKYRISRLDSDFEEICFIISGNPNYGNKGQFLAVAAFYAFEQQFRAKRPEQYRDFSLSLIGVGDDDVAQQLKAMGKSLLSEQFTTYDILPREEAMEITSRHNASICCSFGEAFCLSVAEGMLMGHVLLRNNTGGREEQLQEEVNGYLITEDVKQFAEQIEKLLNKNHANQDLVKMSASSQQIADAFTRNSYLQQISALDPDQRN